MKTTALIVAAILSVSFNSNADRLPPDAEALQAKRDNKVAEIDRIYVEELEKLQKKHMQDGALDAANRIAEEIKKIMPDPFVEPTKVLVGKWKRDLDGTVFEFIDATSGIHAGSTAFTVKHDPDTSVVYLRSAKWVDTVTVSDDPNTISGKNSLGVGYKLTRIK